nr:hypothetical protein [uncultured Flavobacterium sp.]
MKKAIGLFVFSFLLLFVSISYKNSNQLVNNRKLNGKLIEYSSDEIVDNALVTVSENGKIVAQTNVENDGSFSFDELPNKILNLNVENVSYSSVNATIDLVNNKEVIIEKLYLDFKINLLEEILILVKR